ncbi:response regulator [Muricauda sp. CAU 1633]|uniref:hybrid sensor histidine kinase/response regulator transcription factor n=1 Tax=Allomuricauda sp. CAU 1633 TaxID=2816036 RepID=UPI001A9050D2|nr:two-component regulator propeller domain-containing protein [Muricauda sp. CAU 1633]MBO0322202.1 response regulator [Muricauda sp. CAU 1633]
MENITFQKFGVSEGLSSNAVFSSVEDREGFIWIATEEGVDRFNGKDFKHYNLPKLYEYRTANYVEYHINIDSNNRIWLITLGGLLYRYESQRDEFVLYHTIREKPESEQEVNDFYIDHTNKLWIGTYKGVFVFDPDSKLTQKLRGVEVRTSSIIQDDSNNYYLGTENGIYVLDSNKNILFNLLDETQNINTGLRGSQIASLFFDKENNRLWVGSNKLGLCSFNLVNFEFSMPTGLTEYKGLKVRSIVRFSSHEIIVGIDGEGLLIWDIIEGREVGKITPHQNDTESLSSASVHDVYRSSSNVFFVSTFRGGLNVYSPGNLNFKTIRHYLYKKNSLRNNVVLQLFNVAPDIIGFGTDKGISIWDKTSDKWSHLEIDLNGENHISNSRAISVDRYGNIWATSYTDSTIVFKASQKLKYKSTKSYNADLNAVNANKIYANSENSIWFSEDETKRIYHYSLKTGQLDRYPIEIGNVQTLLSVGQGLLAIGTSTGLKFLDTNTGQLSNLPFVNTSQLKSAMISSLAMDENKLLWVGTRYEGLFTINLFKQSIRRLTTGDGLLSNRIFALTSSTNGMWASTSKGLSQIDKSLNVNNFTKSDGLTSVDFSYDAALTDADGNVYFGTSEGVITFNPFEIQPIESKKTILFTDFYLNHRQVLPGRNSPLDTLLNHTEAIELDYAQNSFSFGFTSIDFMHFDKGIFHWKLENFDEHWISNPESTVASYTNLNPGEYTFKLKITGQRDELLAPIKQIALTVNPPFWMTPWAYGLYAILFLFLLGLIMYSYRLWILTKHSRSKLKYLANMAHEIKTPLILIKAPLKDLIKNMSMGAPIRQNLDIALKNAEKVHMQLIQFLDFRKLETNKNTVNPQPMDLIWLVKDKIFAFTILAEKKNISMELKTDLTSLLIESDEGILDKIVGNLLSNAIKYTLEGGRVVVELRVNEKKCEILIKDNGIGIPMAERRKIFRLFYRAHNVETSGSIGTGVGLVLARDLARLINGNVTLVQSSSEGSTFAVKFPFKPLTNLEDPKVTFIEMVLPDQEQSNSVNKETVLIVEDNQDLMEYSRNRLMDEYHVITASNGFEAQKMIRNNLPDIILCDVLMPKMNGFQFCTALKKNIETCHVPIILFSGLGSKENIMQGLECGADDYIVKPYDYELLLSKIEGFLHNRQVLKRKFLLFNETEEEIQFSNELDDKFMSNLTQLVEDNLSDPNFTIKDMCEAMGMSRTSFYHKLKALMDVSPNEFLRTIRLKKGRRMLLEHDYNVSEVAYNVGFSDAKYFGTLFKKYYGENPSSFVANKRKNQSKDQIIPSGEDME